MKFIFNLILFCFLFSLYNVFFNELIKFYISKTLKKLIEKSCNHTQKNDSNLNSDIDDNFKDLF